MFFFNFNLGGAAAQQLPPWMCPCAASIPYPEDRSSSSCNFITLIRPIYIMKARTPVSKEDNRLGQPPQLVDLGLLRYSIIGPPSLYSLANLLPDLKRGFQNTAFCEEDRIHSETTHNGRPYSVSFGTPWCVVDDGLTYVVNDSAITFRLGCSK